MEAAAPSGGGGGGGGGGPAPFLLKTYEMVDDTSTDEIVSWSANKNSFVVWNPPEFARLLLPAYFKHNNFSSFIRQLNTYGFRKIDPERWEFANEDFIKDQKHLLKNIHRRKPIHSHSHPPSSTLDPERAALEEEIERLSRDKTQLEGKLQNSRQKHAAEKLQFEDLAQRVSGMEKRQDNLLTFLERAIENPTFVEHLARKIESMDFSSYSKKRRLPPVDHSQDYVESGSLDNHASSRPESRNICHHDFSNKLRLELSPAVSDVNLVSHCTHSSTEEGGSSLRRLPGEGRDAQIRSEGLFFSPEGMELSDTGASFGLKMNSSLLGNITRDESGRLHQLQHNKTSEDYDSPVSCHLNLTLASSSLQTNRSPYSATMPQVTQELGKTTLDSGSSSHNTRPDTRAPPKSLPSSQEDRRSHQEPVAAPPRVNDVFWEQFLTERPGSSENEEASSNYRANSSDDPDDKSSSHGVSSNSKNMEQLTL